MPLYAIKQPIQLIPILQDVITPLLWDDFSDIRAPGAINGTPCHPGPGTRVTIDLENRMYQWEGKITFAAGKLAAAFGDPGFTLTPGLTRIAGRIYVAKVDVAAGTTQILFLINAVQAPTDVTNPCGLIYFRSASIICQSVGTAPYCGTFTVPGTYTLALVMRATGSFAFIKGEAYTNWTFLWAQETRNDATIYVKGLNYNSIDRGFQWMRAPNQIWLPFPAAWDNFNRVNGVLGSTPATGPDGQWATILPWTDNIGAWAIAGNLAQCTVLAGGKGVATVQTDKADGYFGIKITRTGGVGGMVVRYQDVDNFIYAIHDGVNAQMIERVGGVENTRITAAVAYVAGARLTLTLDGLNARMTYNSANVGTYAATVLGTQTKHGLYSTNVGNTLNDFEVWARGNQGEYNYYLDKYTYEPASVWDQQREANPSFEILGAGGADVFSQWVETAGDGTITVELVNIHTGIRAACLTAGPTRNTVLISENISVAAGDIYRFSFYTRGDGTNAGRWRIRNATAGADIKAWASTDVIGVIYQEVHAIATIPAGCANARLDFQCPDVNAGIAYFDTVSIQRYVPGAPYV